VDEWRDADVVVIGAGLGGLTAAAYLAAAGRRVVVVDRHTVAGGNGTVFHHHGFEFDVGLHYIGDCGVGGLIPSLLAPLGIDLTFREMDPDGFDTFVLPDEVFRVPKGVEALRERLHRRFPAERDAVDAYLEVIKAIDGAITGGPPDVLIANDRATLGQLFDTLHLSPRLRTILAGQHGTYALPPSRVSLVLHAALAMHYLKGAYYPEGGGQAIADRLVSAVRSAGAEILLRCDVTSIDVHRGRVRGVRIHRPSPVRAAGVPDWIQAPVVISNADMKRTILELLPADSVPADLRARVGRFEMALPLFVDYLVIDRDLGAEGHPNTNVWVFPDDHIEGAYATLESGRMPTEPFAYLTFASLKDPTNARLCPPGHTDLQVMTLVPRNHEFWGVTRGPAHGERYRRNPTYLDRKHTLSEALLAVAERGLPGIRESIVYQESATPITHERFVRSTDGTSYGIAGTPEQFLLARPGPATPIERLFLCGASTIAGHGVAAVMSGGVMAAGAVLGVPTRELLAGRFTSAGAAHAAEDTSGHVGQRR
jgi:phytoene dehydrogenase-like protein